MARQQRTRRRRRAHWPEHGQGRRERREEWEREDRAYRGEDRFPGEAGRRDYPGGGFGAERYARAYDDDPGGPYGSRRGPYGPQRGRYGERGYTGRRPFEGAYGARPFEPRYGYGYGGYGAYPGFGSYGPAPYPGYGGRAYEGRPEREWEEPGEERGMWDRATDEVASWLGDEEAERRREMDQFRGRGPKNYTRSDERIREDVCDRLTEDAFVDASDIDVQVSGQEVTLTGTVPSRQQRRRAEDCIEEVSGVRHVQNNLRVQERPPETPSTL